ncbi:uncharacterized protein LOC111359367 isoform X2 [Spodoptera litura]|uniref:Uncharacterized protein LOC111359367 isoform X2 n=1 Tax=Spodoptera litura TaxID=69820 RepID=A0A9J7IZH9_SPOLT|nr:uncharacterized protein LOC111359367 isoform X2 [Spodoptera litura]
MSVKLRSILKKYFGNFCFKVIKKVRLFDMASGGDAPVTILPKHMTYSKSRVPILGALIDYVDTSVQYLRKKTFAQAEKLHAKSSRATLSASFLASVCLMLGFVCNVKFEVVTVDEEPLPNDLHFMLMSKEDKLYIDDIDVSRVMWCVEASDSLVILISSLLIWNSSNRSPLSEYLFLPWLGATLRGLFLRQAPTAGALLYTMAVINGNVNPLFLTAFSFLFLLEARLWLEIARLVRSRWERREHAMASHDSEYEVETLWSNDDVQSIEMRNYVY